MEDDHDTDPEIFKPSEVTTRRCQNCGAEVGPDELAFRRGADHVLDVIRELLEARGEMPLAAEEIAHAIAKRAGLTL